MSLRTQGPLRELFLDLTLADARPPAGPALEVRWALANSWSVPTAVQREGRRVELMSDEQADTLTLTLRLPWARAAAAAAPGLLARLATTLEWRLTHHWGGWSDRSVESLHAAMGVFDYNRRDFARGQVRLYLREVEGSAAFALESPRLAVGDVVARTQLTLLQGGAGARALALRLDVKAPLGRLERAGGSEGWDVGAGLAGTLALSRRLVVHAMASVSTPQGLPSPFPLQPRRWQLGAEASLVLRLGGWSLLLEDRLRSPLLEGGWVPLAQPGTSARAAATWALFYAHNQLSVGVRRGGLTLWFAEDFTPGRVYAPPSALVFMANAPDFAAGVTWTWAP